MNINNYAIEDLLNAEKCNDLVSLLDSLHSITRCNIQCVESITSDLIDLDFLEEIRDVSSCGIPIYFGKSLRDLKCVITDESGVGHVINLLYKSSKKLAITSVSLPHSPLQDIEYICIKDILKAFETHVNSLAGYFRALERIDRFCTIVDPINPTYKEDYRRILLDDRIWLHVEVTSEGLATNIHLIGQSEQWHDKLQAGLLNWNHDEDIVENIMNIFELTEFPAPINKSAIVGTTQDIPAEVPVCNICLCSDLAGSIGVPQPLCQSPLCGVYFHRNCLFQWLVACAGGRPPAFGVATGSCPTCFQPIACNERDN